jgi:lysozyme
MTPSPACARLIQQFESCRLTAYLPTQHDRWTIGWGQTGPDIGEGTTWTQGAADADFARSLALFGQGVDSLITGGASQGQFDAMVSLAYNIGLSAFAASTLLRLHNAADYALVPPQFLRWDTQAGKVLGGLLRRRQAEAAMYRGAA